MTSQDEDIVLSLLPLWLDEKGMLPARYQHLMHAIASLDRKGIIVLLANGLGARWVLRDKTHRY